MTNSSDLSVVDMLMHYEKIDGYQKVLFDTLIRAYQAENISYDDVRACARYILNETPLIRTDEDFTFLLEKLSLLSNVFNSLLKSINAKKHANSDEEAKRISEIQEALKKI